MNIYEVTIKQATFEMATQFTVRLNVYSDAIDGMLTFSMTSSSDRTRLQRLFELTGVTELSALCSKKLRVVLGNDFKIKAFGHISEDRFFPLKNPSDLMHKDEVISFIRAFAA